MHPLFGRERPEQVSLGASLALEEVAPMLSLVREFANDFAWSHADMPGVLPKLVEHHLSLRNDCRLVRQRLRQFHPTQQEVIKWEVGRLLEAKFITEI